MSIFRHITAKDEGRYVYDRIRPLEVTFASEDTGNRTPYGIDRNKEWLLELRIRQNFWANDVQRAGIQESATRMVAATLYEDVLRELPRLRLCILSGDKDGALEATFRIEKATQP